ncbi:PilZ domain-containing protein [bacterium]|jgi:hypothetical protein|nr:PilZ domain-containing protein [bacterium]
MNDTLRTDSSGRSRPARLLLKPRVSSPDQKRTSDRTTTHRTVLARVEGQEKQTEVPLLDLSPTGLKITAGQELDQEAVLIVEVAPGRILQAAVKWCKAADDNFHIGAEWTERISIDDVWKIRSDYER